MSHLCQHPPLIRNPGRQHPVKSANAIRGHNQQPLAKIINISHFSPSYRHARNFTSQQGSRHETISLKKHELVTFSPQRSELIKESKHHSIDIKKPIGKTLSA